MAYTTIDKPTDYFNTKLYTGNGSTQSITGVGFQPDWVWIKQRNGTFFHRVFDVIRGVEKELYPNDTSAEVTDNRTLQSFDTDGFSLGTFSGTNGSGNTFASWNWLASNTTASNTDGSITSTVSANTTSGFSIVSYTGTGSTATVGHSLGTTPSIIIAKKRDTSGTDWITWGSILGGTVGSEFIKLNATNGKTTGLNSSWFNNTAPTSSVFTIGTQSDLNGSSATYIAYCFAEKKGFSKFGSYTGNGSTDGTFVYTGFKPAWVMVKSTSNAEDWNMIDNKRDPFNNGYHQLVANSSNAENTTDTSRNNFYSNGFKLGTTNGAYNGSGYSYIYMAFASSPFTTSTGIPTVAR